MEGTVLETAKQTSAWTGLAVSTLYALAHADQIPHVHLGQQMIRFPRAEVAKWLAGRVHGGREKAS